MTFKKIYDVMQNGCPNFLFAKFILVFTKYTGLTFKVITICDSLFKVVSSLGWYLNKIKGVELCYMKNNFVTYVKMNQLADYNLYFLLIL